MRRLTMAAHYMAAAGITKNARPAGMNAGTKENTTCVGGNVMVVATLIYLF